MTGTIIDDNEIIAKGEGVIKGGGNCYIKKGRDHISKRVKWFILND